MLNTFLSSLRFSCRRHGVAARVGPGLLVLAVMASACSPAPVSAPVSADDAIASIAAGGHSDDVAECIVGLVTGRIDPAALVGDIKLTPADELALDEATKNCEIASDLLAADREPPPDLAFDDLPQDYGDDDDLDQLWDDCADGLGDACDSLWAEAPIGSNYERFGVTCGERFEILNCASDMDESADDDADSSDADSGDADDDADSGDAESTDADASTDVDESDETDADDTDEESTDVDQSDEVGEDAPVNDGNRY